MKAKLAFIVIIVLLVSCREKQPVLSYEGQSRLEKIINELTHINLGVSGSNSIVILLQNESCVCTEENMKLSKDILESNMFSDYQTIVITKGKEHKFISMISPLISRRVKFYSDTSNYLFSHGYITATDKIIIYNNGNVKSYSDLHIIKPVEARKNLLEL